MLNNIFMSTQSKSTPKTRVRKSSSPARKIIQVTAAIDKGILKRLHIYFTNLAASSHYAVTKLSPPLSTPFSHHKITNSSILRLKTHNEPTDKLHPGMGIKCLKLPAVIIDTQKNSEDGLVEILLVNDCSKHHISSL